MSKSPFRVKTSLGILDGFADDATYQASVGSLKRGDYYYNTTSNSFRFYNGSIFQNITSIENRAVVRAYDLSFVSPPSGPQTIDSVPLNIGDLVLLTSTPSSGIYRVESGTWTLQAVMQDPTGNAKSGDEVRVTAGSVYGNKTFIFNGSVWVPSTIPVPTVQKSTLYGQGTAYVENPTVLTDLWSMFGVNDSVNDSAKAANFTIHASNKTTGTGDGGNLILSGGSSFDSNIGSIELHSLNTIFFSNGSEIARFDSFGNLGIGISSPTSVLDIRGFTQAVAKIYGQDNINNGIYLGSSDTNMWAATQNAGISNRSLDFWSYKSGVGGSNAGVLSLKTTGQTKFWPLASDPTPQQEEGDLYYNLTNHEFRFFDGTSWQKVGTGSGGLVKVDLYNPTSTSLVTGSPVVVDGVTVTNNQIVLFSNLGSGNNEAYKATVVAGNVTAWTAQSLFGGSPTPTNGDEAIVLYGTGFANQVGEFNGTTWLFNNKVRYFNGTDYWEQSALYTVNIVNNTTANIFSVAFSGSENIIVDYSIIRGTSKETGSIFVTTDGSTVAVASDNAGLADSGISFLGSISGSNLVLSYTSTNTGQSGTMKFSIKRWSDVAGGPGGPPSYTGGGGSSITGSGSNGQITYWSGPSTVTGNSNYTFDSANLLVNKGILQETIMTSATLIDNTPSPTAIFTLPTASYNSVILHYSIARGTNTAAGRMMITTDGTTVSYDNDFVENNSTGVTLSVDVSGSNIRVLYMSTSTGSNATFKWTEKRWL